MLLFPKINDDQLARRQWTNSTALKRGKNWKNKKKRRKELGEKLASWLASCPPNQSDARIVVL